MSVEMPRSLPTIAQKVNSSLTSAPRLSRSHTHCIGIFIRLVLFISWRWKLEPYGRRWRRTGEQCEFSNDKRRNANEKTYSKPVHWVIGTAWKRANDRITQQKIVSVDCRAMREAAYKNDSNETMFLCFPFAASISEGCFSLLFHDKKIVSGNFCNWWWYDRSLRYFHEHGMWSDGNFLMLCVVFI